MSLFLVGLQKGFQLEWYEQNVYDFLDRIESREEIHKIAADYLLSAYNYKKMKSQFREKYKNNVDKNTIDAKNDIKLIKESNIEKYKYKFEYKLSSQ